MNWKIWQARESKLEKPIDKVLTELNTYSPNDPEWDANLKRLKKLTDMKGKDKPRFNVSPDELLKAGATLLGILIVVGYEQKHVWTTKAQDVARQK